MDSHRDGSGPVRGKERRTQNNGEGRRDSLEEQRGQRASPQGLANLLIRGLRRKFQAQRRRDSQLVGQLRELSESWLGVGCRGLHISRLLPARAVGKARMGGRG